MRMEADRGPTPVHPTQRAGNTTCLWTYPQTIWRPSVEKMDFKQKLTGGDMREVKWPPGLRLESTGGSSGQPS